MVVECICIRSDRNFQRANTRRQPRGFFVTAEKITTFAKSKEGIGYGLLLTKIGMTPSEFGSLPAREKRFWFEWWKAIQEKLRDKKEGKLSLKDLKDLKDI